MSLYGKLLYKDRIVEAGIEVEDGRIKRIGKNIKGRKVRGLILPAAIDVHVHFRDFKEKHKETIESGSLSAIYGGVCLVVDQPNCKPPILDAKTYEERMKKAEKRLYCDYTLNFGLVESNSKKLVDEVSKVSEKYFVPAVGEVFLQHNEMQVSYETLFEFSKSNLNITIHAEDPELVKCNSIPNFDCRPEEAEITAVKKCVDNIKEGYFCHLSTLKALKIAKNFKKEVTLHHLLLTKKDYNRLNYLVNVNPPLRDEPLLKYLNDFDVIASDHAPHTIDEKKDGLPGFPGVETTYPILVNLIKEGIVGIKAVEMLTLSPAKIFGFDKFGYGCLDEGMLANFVVFDFSKECKINARNLHSKSGWTPYEGFKAIFPSEVWIRGERVIPEEICLGKVLKLKS